MRYSKTEAGQQAFKARSPLLSARQRSAFILFDGIKSSEQVLAAAVGLGISRDDIDHLVQQEFLVAAPEAMLAPASVASVASASNPANAGAVAPQALAVSTRSLQERYSAAMPIATKVTASLGLRGFRLNLAVEAASGYEGLLALLPKIQQAAGAKSCIALEQALKG